tara:strand:+ start:758 stop:919 length:162 start_codon:yes stop_codon:yes gene_type:complete
MVKVRLQPMLGHATVWLRRKGWIRQRGDRYRSFAALESTISATGTSKVAFNWS